MNTNNAVRAASFLAERSSFNMLFETLPIPRSRSLPILQSLSIRDSVSYTLVRAQGFELADNQDVLGKFGSTCLTGGFVPSSWH